MKKLIMFGVLLCGMSLAYANPWGPYVGAWGAKHIGIVPGPSNHSWESGKGGSGGICGGYGWANGFRIEGELAFRAGLSGSADTVIMLTDPQSGMDYLLDVSVEVRSPIFTAMANLVYVVPFGCLRPYLGVGTGYGIAKDTITVRDIHGRYPEVTASHNDSIALPLQFFTGMEMDVTDGLVVQLEYRFFDGWHSRQVHSIGIGIRQFI